MATIQEVIDIARVNLNDDAKTRWPDVKLLVFANDGIQRVIELRPDVFLGQFSSLPSGNLALGATCPLPDRYHRALADYILARANMNGSEEGAIEKSAAYAQLFGSEI